MGHEIVVKYEKELKGNFSNRYKIIRAGFSGFCSLMIFVHHFFEDNFVFITKKRYPCEWISQGLHFGAG